MQELIVQVPDNKLSFFKDLLKNLGYVASELSSKAAIETDRPRLKGTASSLRGKLSPMTNEQIDAQFKNMREEWERDI